MSDSTLALILTLLVIAVLFAWVPLLHMAEAFTSRARRAEADEIPDLVEEDAGPQFTGTVA